MYTNTVHFLYTVSYIIPTLALRGVNQSVGVRCTVFTVQRTYRAVMVGSLWRYWSYVKY